MKVIVVSNRGPFSIESAPNEELNLKQNIGGLATSLHSYLSKSSLFGVKETIWIHTSETQFSENEVELLEDEYRIKPIFIEPVTYNLFYNACCNQQLYPSLLNILDCYTEDEKSICAYEMVNVQLRDAVLEVYEPGDIIWVHDYHFLLLPKLLKEVLPAAYLIFFLHTPFPNYAQFQQKLPSAFLIEILESLLYSDKIGFQTEQYSHNFKECINNKLSAITMYQDNIAYNGRNTLVRNNPISVDFEYYNRLSIESLHSPVRKKLLATHAKKKILLSIDRLDTSKGLINKLEAFDLFLTCNPEWVDEVVFIFIVAPSREELLPNKKLLEDIINKVYLINSKFINEPIKFFYQRYTVDELIVFYSITDLLLITSFYDGVNLISKEYIASRFNHDGVVILSQYAGASVELLDALMIDPYNISDIADKIKQGVSMSDNMQREKMSNLRSFVRTNDIKKWGNALLGEYFEQRSQLLTKIS